MRIQSGSGIAPGAASTYYLMKLSGIFYKQTHALSFMGTDIAADRG